MLRLSWLYTGTVLRSFNDGELTDPSSPITFRTFRNGVEIFGFDINVDKIETGWFSLSFTTPSEEDGWSIFDRLQIYAEGEIEGIYVDAPHLVFDSEGKSIGPGAIEHLENIISEIRGILVPIESIFESESVTLSDQFAISEVVASEPSSIISDTGEPAGTFNSRPFWSWMSDNVEWLLQWSGTNWRIIDQATGLILVGPTTLSPVGGYAAIAPSVGMVTVTAVIQSKYKFTEFALENGVAGNVESEANRIIDELLQHGGNGPWTTGIANVDVELLNQYFSNNQIKVILADTTHGGENALILLKNYSKFRNIGGK